MPTCHFAWELKILKNLEYLCLCTTEIIGRATILAPIKPYRRHHSEDVSEEDEKAKTKLFSPCSARLLNHADNRSDYESDKVSEVTFKSKI